MRDSFKSPAIALLSQRAGNICSNPACQTPTSGPDGGAGKASIGVAAHITAAAEGGPRYNPDLTREERSSAENGIWLCQTCSRLIDVDVEAHSTTVLQEWKKLAEIRAFLALRGLEVIEKRGFEQLESKLPALLSEMREDLQREPFVREFYIMGRRTAFDLGDRSAFAYHHEDHDQLLGKMKICENFGAVTELGHRKLPRFCFTEDFVDYLERTSSKVRAAPAEDG